MQYEVVLPAAGSGKRMGAGQNKLFLVLNDKPILMHTLLVFQEDEKCTGIWLAVKDEEREYIQKLLMLMVKNFGLVVLIRKKVGDVK